MRNKQKLVKLHLACGTNVVGNGWTNVDNNSDNNIVKKLDLNWDLREPLPYEDNYADRILHEHFIEHLPKAEGEKFLRECYRLLKPGGVMRIGWPDTARMIKAYQTQDKKYFDYVSVHVDGGMKFQSWDELLVDFFYSWQHRYGYTSEHLKQLLTLIGFRDVKFKKFMQSDYGFDIDVRDDPATTYLEVVK